MCSLWIFLGFERKFFCLWGPWGRDKTQSHGCSLLTLSVHCLFFFPIFPYYISQTIFRGIYNKTEVAIKVIHPNLVSDKMISDFKAEAELMRYVLYFCVF